MKATKRISAELDKQDIIDWRKVQDEVQSFNVFLATLDSIAKKDSRVAALLRGKSSRKYLEKLANGEAPGMKTRTEFSKWLRKHWPQTKARMPIVDANTDMEMAAEDLLEAVKARDYGQDDGLGLLAQTLTRHMKEYAKVVGSFVSEAGAAKFRHSGVTILNPSLAPDAAVKQAIEGIDYLRQLFKKRGVSSVLEDNLNAVILRPKRRNEQALGWYNPDDNTLTFVLDTLKYRGGGMRFLKSWLEEVFLHEIGHHVHMRLLPRVALEFWNSGWQPIDQAKQKAKYVTPEDRVRFWDLLTKTRGNFRAMRLNPLDRMKMHALLRKPLKGPPLVTPTQLKWSKEAERLVALLQDPFPLIEETYGATGPDAEGWIEDLMGRFKENLAVGGRYANRAYPVISDDSVQKYMESNTEVAKAIEALQPPSEYAKTDVWEDFAETFVAFMDAPGKLSDTAKYRMQRTLHLAGLHGKPIMKTVASYDHGNYEPLGKKRLSEADLLVLGRKWCKLGKKVSREDLPVMVEAPTLWKYRCTTPTRECQPGGRAGIANGPVVSLDGPVHWDTISEDMALRGWDKSCQAVLGIDRKGRMLTVGPMDRLAIAFEQGLRDIPTVLVFVADVSHLMERYSPRPPVVSKPALRKALLGRPEAERKLMSPEACKLEEELLKLT